MKAFISHSSAQKDFAEKILEGIGPDHCILDKYDFMPAYPSIQEIMEKIGASTMLVFLISKESLASPWCETEIKKAHDLAQQGKLKLFLPYVIDPEVTLESVKEKYDWIVSEETYNLRYFRSPVMLARDIELKFRRLGRSSNLYTKAEEIFVGRNDKVNEFQTQKSNKRKAKSLIVSGRPGTGRHRFCRKCADDTNSRDNYFFETITMPKRGQVSNLIVELNPITYYYSEQELNDILIGSEEAKYEAAVNLLNEILKHHGKILIIDDGAIVDYKSDLPDWFEKLLSHPELKARLGLYVISRSQLRSTYELNNTNIIAIRMQEFTKQERINIFTTLLDLFGITDISDQDIEFFVDRLRQSPAQLVKIIKIIHRNGIAEARRSVERIRQEGDFKISELISTYKDSDTESADLLTLLARTGMLSYDDLKVIYADKYESIIPNIEELREHSLIYESGASGSILRIDGAVGDYLERLKRSLPQWLSNNLDKYLRDRVNHTANLAESPSLYILRCKQALKDGRFDVKNLLLPTIAIDHLISLYNRGDKYREVIHLCKQLQDNDLPVFIGEELKQEILMWECLSYAHLDEKEAFYDCKRKIRDKASQLFLSGFFENQIGDYQSAYQHLKNALGIRKEMRQARREIVKALMGLKRYGDALEYAEKNFHDDMDNKYHITAYFRCLLQKNDRTAQDEVIMRDLIGRMRDSLHKDSEEIVAGMEMLWKVRKPRPNRPQLYNELRELKHLYPHHKYVQDVVEQCYAILK